MIEWIITSSLLISIIILLRFILRGKINLILQYSLWVLVLIRLLMPINFFSSSLSVINFLVKQTDVEETYKEIKYEEPNIEDDYTVYYSTDEDSNRTEPPADRNTVQAESTNK